MSDNVNNPHTLSAETLSLKLLNFQPIPHLVIDEVLVDVNDVSYISTDGALTAKSGLVIARLSAGNLEKYLIKQLPNNISGVSLKLTDGTIKLTGLYSILISNLPFEVVGRLDIKNGSALVFKVIRAAPAEGLISNHIEKLNPVFDVSNLALSISLKLNEVLINSEYVELKASPCG